MSFPLTRQFTLAGPEGDGRHAYVNKDGAFIGRGVPLLEQDALGRWKPPDSGVLEHLFAEGYGIPVRLGGRTRQLHYVALNKGDLALANISLVRAQLPPIPSSSHARAMAKADGRVLKYNPDWDDEPHVPEGDPGGGEWTSEGGDAARGDSAGARSVSDRLITAQAKKQRFVDSHLADAQTVADQLGVPVENILGVSALESEWGDSRFATQGNNYFGIHYPAPFATGYVVAGQSGVKVATFASYADSLRSFAAISGDDVQGLSNPRDFAAALRDSGKFGVGNPNYADVVSNTIDGLRAIVSRRKD